MCSVDSRADFSVVPEVTNPRTLPGARARITRAWPSRPEADAARAGIPPEIRDAGHDHVRGTVLGLEHDHPRPVLVQGALQLVCRRGLDEDGDHLPALEADLDANTLL